MRAALALHPASECDAVRGIEIEIDRPAPQQLAIQYRLSGSIEDIRVPAADGGRRDELWRHTCLEAFVRVAGDPGYVELNLSPGGAWAAYRFESYRHGMAEADIPPPDARPRAVAGSLELVSLWDLDLAPDAPWKIGVSAVIEERDGRISYWALRHPAGRPDFHHADGFVLELPAPSAL